MRVHRAPPFTLVPVQAAAAYTSPFVKANTPHKTTCLAAMLYLLVSLPYTIDLQKMNWKMRAGLVEQTGVSLKERFPNHPIRRIHP